MKSECEVNNQKAKLHQKRDMWASMNQKLLANSLPPDILIAMEEC